MNIVIYHENFAKIGGIETFIFNFCKMFGNEHKITIISTNIRYIKIFELAKYVNIYTAPYECECDLLLLTRLDSNKRNIEKIKCKKTLQMVHCDLKDFYKFHPDYKFNFDCENYICVSETAKNSLKECKNIDSIVIPNIILGNEEKDFKILRLVSATRLSEEKGYNRMKKLCDMLENFGILYEWDVYTNNQRANTPYKNIKFKEPIKDIEKLYKNYDYVVQLSDSESFCYTMYEALIRNVPCITTPFGNALEEIIEGRNGYIVPFNMNITKEQINKIVNEIPKNFSYEQKGVKEKWEKIMNLK